MGYISIQSLVFTSSDIMMNMSFSLHHIAPCEKTPLSNIKPKNDSPLPLFVPAVIFLLGPILAISVLFSFSRDKRDMGEYNDERDYE